MGALQLGTPNPTMILDSWHLKVIDLKDCFFTIHLHPEDCVPFAFSVPVINNDRPMQWFHWVVLPQGMKNSPTLCQIVVSEALSNICKTYDSIMLYHYMDDILLAVETESSLSQVFDSLVAKLQRYGLQIATEKVQSLPPWRYLGWKLLDSHVYPQSIRLATTVSTLNDLQKLLRTINWLRPLLGITTHELSPLFSLLKGNPELTSPRQLTEAAQSALQTVIDKINFMFAH
nr:PREDICTED: endogenous retrovirus group K member 18 Pol protein-like [Balearica regulorum gibbericeps]